MLNISTHVSTATPLPVVTATPRPSLAESAPSAIGPPDTPSSPGKTDLCGQLADKANLKTLGQALRDLATRMGKDATPEAILEGVKNTSMAIDPASSYLAPGNGSVSLEAFIEHLGVKVPAAHFHLNALADAVIDRALEHPLGNLGGALSWPTPLASDEQRRLRAFTLNHVHHLGDKPLVMQTQDGVLEFLRYRQPLPADAQNDPAKILNALISSPRAQLMGKDIQEKMQGIDTGSSVTDYLLAGIALQMDPESITAPRRNSIAGFDLASEQHWGKPASAVVEGLAAHLSATKRTSPALAHVGAHLLLASRAPMFLIKDIPASVTYGSTAWMNLAVAAATIEARTPGKVPNMTFADVMREAESASLADRSITQHAQAAALVDWGVANGVIGKNLNDDYSDAQLDTVRTAFNEQLDARLTATKALDEPIPTRKEIALARLQERFGDLGPLFEEKVLSTDAYRGTDKQIRLVGEHSMLDIAMMDLPDPAPFKSDDPRIPLEALNANLSFGVRGAFEQEFSQSIKDKKSAVNTTIRHLISQLPLADRKNFEFGKVTLFQEGSHELGLGFTDKTYGPNKPGLLVRTELNGVSAAYEINFNKGTIEPTHLWRAEEQSSSRSRWVSTTKPFKPDEGADLLSVERPVNESQLNTFSGDRSHAIANAFVQHLELDDPSIKANALGQTTLDELQGGPKPLTEFLLNLIPFRSAIVNFQKGNYGEGAFDLALDVFGFLTAGAAAAGKLMKISSSALSSGAKALRAAKVIGAATIGALNPLSGLGDLAAGGARVLGQGASFLATRGAEAIHKLRGASGSYDLLNAVSKEHGTALIGTFTAGNRSIETVSVLKNDQWYHYNPDKNELYGLPIKDFKPKGASEPPTFNAQGEREFHHMDLKNNILAAQTPPNLPRYNLGHSRGLLENVKGYHKGMDSAELRQLASKTDRTPEEMGVLTREIKKKDLENAQYASRLLTHDVSAPGVRVVPVSQVHYLANVDITSRGECAGLSNAMALAVHQGKEDKLMQNLYRAADNPSDPKAALFIQQLKDLQDSASRKTTFHMGKPHTKKPYQDIIEDLTNSPQSKTLRITTKDHAMLAGIRVEAGKTDWFFYEPNSGMATFTTLQSMQEGMEKALNSGNIAATLLPYGKKRGTREYSVSTFDPTDMNVDFVNKPALQQLIDAQL